MPDEIATDQIETGINSSDGHSAEEFLFGDAEDDEAAGVTEDQDATEETALNADVPDGAGEMPDSNDAGESDDPAGTESSEDLKVVLSIRGERAIIGVQQPSADPHFESFDGLDLLGLALQVPQVVERARARWEEAPKYPAYEKPAPPARRQRQRRQAPVEAATEQVAGQDANTQGATEQEEAQQTLRLF